MASTELELEGEVLALLEGEDVGIVLVAGAVRYEFSVAAEAITAGSLAAVGEAGGSVRAEIFADGTITFSVAQTVLLAAGPLERVEAWEIRGSDNLLAVAAPKGGGVAVFDQNARAFPVREAPPLPMPGIVGPDGQAWNAPISELDDVVRAAVPVARDERTLGMLSAALGPGGLVLGVDDASFAVAAVVRTAIALLCEPILRERPRQPDHLAVRDRLHELDVILQRVLTPHRRTVPPTFPTRRHIEQFDEHGHSIADAAAIFGLTCEAADSYLRARGFRRLTQDYRNRLMMYRPHDLTVIADDGRVTNIMGLQC